MSRNSVVRCPTLPECGSRCRRGHTCLAHNLLCNPHYVVFSAIWPIDICCPARPQFTFLRVVWPVPGSVRLVGIHEALKVSSRIEAVIAVGQLGWKLPGVGGS